MTLTIVGDSGWYQYGNWGKVQWASCWAQRRGAYPHINSCTALSHLMKGLITGMWKREYWNLIVQIRQSAPLFPMYNLQCPTKPHWDTHAHATCVFLLIYVALRQWYMHIICLEAKSWRFIETDWIINVIFTSILSGGLIMNSERLLDNHDIIIMTSLDTWMEHNMRKTRYYDDNVQVPTHTFVLKQRDCNTQVRWSNLWNFQ